MIGTVKEEASLFRVHVPSRALRVLIYSGEAQIGKDASDGGGHQPGQLLFVEIGHLQHKRSI